MRITYLYQYFKTRQMSGGTRTFEMARRLVRMGHEVTVITADSSPAGRRGWRETEESGIRVLWAGVPYSNSFSYSKRILAFMRFASRSALRASSVPADVVVASSTPLTIALPGVWAKRRLDVPMVLEVRDLWPELPIAIGALRNPLARSAARRLEGFAYRNADRIVALSPGMKDGVVRRGYPSEHVHVIPNSSDIELFRVPKEVGLRWRQKHPEVGDRPMVLYAGTIGRMNGVDWLVRLAEVAASINPKVCFVIVGEGSEHTGVERLADDLGVLGRNLFMFPSMPKREMPAVTSAATVCTSLFIDLEAMWHNSANKFFDALAAARPVAINYRGWQADLLEEAGAGAVLPVRDLTEAAKLLVDRILNESWIASAGAAAGRLAADRFDRSRLARDLGDVLAVAVAEHRRNT